jgi:hypothetical protein
MNHLTDEKQMEELLTRATPNSTGELDQRLASAPWTTRTANRRRTVGVTTLAVLIVTLIFVATPQGSAIAQDILQFFTRTESDTYYQPFEDIPFEETTPFHEQCGTPIFPTCSVDEIRDMVDFEVKEIGNIPDGIYYVGATGGPDFVELKYGYENRFDGNLSVGVEAVGKPSAVGTGITAKSAEIEQVQIGDLPGEYYTGILFQDENGNVSWQPDDFTSTLRWEDAGSTYTLSYYSTTIPLSKEELIALAETMTTDPVEKQPLPAGFIR